MNRNRAVACTTAAAALLIIHILNVKKRKKRKPRWWMKKMYRERLQCGNRLMQDMHFEESGSIENFVRMSLQDFENILKKVEPKIKKMNTNYREAITARERLAITLRFLATGDSYTSLQYLFRISKQSTSTIVIEVCDAIIEALKDHVMVS